MQFSKKRRTEALEGVLVLMKFLCIFVLGPLVLWVSYLSLQTYQRIQDEKQVNEALAYAKQWGCPPGRVVARPGRGIILHEAGPRCVSINETCLLYPEHFSLRPITFCDSGWEVVH